MKVYLVGGNGRRYLKQGYTDFNCLESYHYMNDKLAKTIPMYRDFILDSGAFTYLNGAKSDVNWERYIDQYADFIKKYNVRNYIELDIDPIVGIKEVERLRSRLETRTGRPSMPVWHKSRGKEYWLKMVKDYDYVAIGGIVTKEIKPSEYKYFHWLLAQAKKHSCRVHGLGFTNLKGLDTYDFYSVDSTSWISGNKFGAIYKFNGRTLLKYDREPHQRVKKHETADNNFYEWVKFANYKEGV